jgi:hypothetical protein
MVAIWLTWVPEQGKFHQGLEDYEASVRNLRPGPGKTFGIRPRHEPYRWTVGKSAKITDGVEAYLVVQGRLRGIIGKGVVRGEPRGEGREQEVDVDFSRLLAFDDRLDRTVLLDHVEGFPERILRSGLALGEIEADVANLWEKHVAALENRGRKAMRG